MSQPPPSPGGGRGSSRLVVCNHGTTDGEDEATGREAGGCPAPRTGSAERARRRCSSPCRPARGRSLVDCSHRASRITAVEKCGRCGRQLISSICCRGLTASLYLRGGVAVLWGTEVSRLRRRGARGTESGVNGRRLDEPAQALEHLPRLLLLRFASLKDGRRSSVGYKR